MPGKICIPIQAQTLAELDKKLTEAEKEADFIEIWLDQIPYLQLGEIPEIVKKVKKPLIVVCKGKKERGAFRGPTKKRVEILKAALKAGADYADIDIDTDPKLIKSLKKHGKIIISYHNFKKTPRRSTLQKIAQKAQKLSADIIKIATFANNKADNLAILELVAHISSEGQDIVALCMGKEGQQSRISSTEVGGFLMFAPLKKTTNTAPGQLTISELRKAWK